MIGILRLGEFDWLAQITTTVNSAIKVQTPLWLTPKTHSLIRFNNIYKTVASFPFALMIYKKIWKLGKEKSFKKRIWVYKNNIGPEKMAQRLRVIAGCSFWQPSSVFCTCANWHSVACNSTYVDPTPSPGLHRHLCTCGMLMHRHTCMH